MHFSLASLALLVATLSVVIAAPVASGSEGLSVRAADSDDDFHPPNIGNVETSLVNFDYGFDNEEGLYNENGIDNGDFF